MVRILLPYTWAISTPLRRCCGGPRCDKIFTMSLKSIPIVPNPPAKSLILLVGAPEGIRTPDLCLRRANGQSLGPVTVEASITRGGTPAQPFSANALLRAPTGACALSNRVAGGSLAIPAGALIYGASSDCAIVRFGQFTRGERL